MGEFVVKVPEELRVDMDEFPDVEWSVVVRKLLKAQVLRMRELKAIVAKSAFTEQDVVELSAEVDEAVARRFRAALKERSE
jgi:hypothetical protein